MAGPPTSSLYSPPMMSLSLAPGYTGIAAAKTAPFMGLSLREKGACFGRLTRPMTTRPASPARITSTPRWVQDMVLPSTGGEFRPPPESPAAAARRHHDPPALGCPNPPRRAIVP